MQNKTIDQINEELANLYERQKAVETTRRALRGQAIDIINQLIALCEIRRCDLRFAQAEPAVEEQRTHALRGRRLPVRFRGPNGETWSGQGRTPNWLKALEDAGESRETYRVA